MREPTGAERYLEERMRDPSYRGAYERSRSRIGQVDRIVRALDARRQELNLSKAELARRAEMAPEAVRRLFSAERPNPTLQTLAAIADALGLDLVPATRGSRMTRPSSTEVSSDASGTHRRIA
jgi:DNA-binding phage protein